MRNLSRRGFLVGAGGVAATVLAACGKDEPSAPAAQSSGPWEFTDDRGQKITRDKRPERIVTYVSSGAALWDFGVKPVGAFGPQKTESGAKELQAGNIDVNNVTSVGNAWDDFNVEKFIALNPDLVVTGLTGTAPTDLWAITPEIGEKITKVAPILALSEFKVPLPKVIERYGQLATALGGAISGKDDFQKASDDLRSAAKERQGLKVLVLYSEKDGIYVAKPEFFADLAYYRELGLDIVSGGGSEDYWEQLSWEQVSKYPADLILTDTRTFSLTQQQMMEFPTWRQLPAVQAGQLGAWSAEPRFNYQLATPIIRALTDVVRRSRTDIAA
jgi:iron complex transport system substrate-binding protein